MVGLGSNYFVSTWEGSFVWFDVGPLSWCLKGLDGGHRNPNQDTRSEASCSGDAHVLKFPFPCWITERASDVFSGFTVWASNGLSEMCDE